MTDPQHPTPHVTLYHGNNLHILPTIPDASIDSIVTDPPYELGFMGKQWDSTGIAYNVNLWTECLRVLKPGGHLLAFGGTRTYHRMAVAIEDAGFDIRDSLHWIYGSGFPKSLDVSKAIDKAAGVEREVVGVGAAACEWIERGEACQGHNDKNERYGETVHSPLTIAATDAAKQWDGWGTALKPAHEPIVLARKPLIGTVAANVLQHGTGALNIDGCRVGTDQMTTHHTLRPAGDSVVGRGAIATGATSTHQGRWPANIITDGSIDDDWTRYFYVAKPSKKERNAGLDGLPERERVFMGSGGRTFRDGEWVETHSEPQPRANFHPTVKPLALMQWLIRLVTPPDGTVLDPFAGSGTTLAAATLEGINSIGIELTDDYLPIITARCQWAETQHNQPDPEPTLFDNHD